MSTETFEKEDERSLKRCFLLGRKRRHTVCHSVGFGDRDGSSTVVLESRTNNVFGRLTKGTEVGTRVGLVKTEMWCRLH